MLLLLQFSSRHNQYNIICILYHTYEYLLAEARLRHVLVLTCTEMMEPMYIFTTRLKLIRTYIQLYLVYIRITKFHFE